MSLPLPTPPSNSFEDNVDLLIQDLLKNMAGINYSPAQIMQRSGRDRAIIFQILDRIRLTGLPTSTNGTGNTMIDLGSFLQPINAFIDCGTFTITPLP